MTTPPVVPFQSYTASASDAAAGQLFYRSLVPRLPGPRYQNTAEPVGNGFRVLNGVAVQEVLVTIWDFYGGLNSIWGRFEGVPNKMASSTAWTHIPGYVMLPWDITAANPSAAWTNINGFHAENIFGLGVIGIGSTANNSLYTAVGGVPSVRTFTPGSTINGLKAVVSRGATNALALHVLKRSNAIEVLTDLAATPTSAGSMHAGTSPGWGIQVSPIDGTLVGYINGGISTLAKTAAIGDAWTLATANVPNGGFAIGLSKTLGPIRMFWVVPFATTANGGLVVTAQTAQQVFQLCSTNINGTDFIIHTIPIRGFFTATIWNNGIMYTDREEAYFFNDGQSMPLGFQSNRRTPPATGQISATDYFIDGFCTVRERLYVWVYVITSSNGAWHWELFEPENNSWHQTSEATAAADFTVQRPSPAGAGYLFTESSDIMHTFYQDGTTNTAQWFVRQSVPKPSENPYTSLDGTFNASAVVTSTIWTIGPPGSILIPDEIAFGGQLDSLFQSASSNGDASVAIAIGAGTGRAPTFTRSLTVTFNERDRPEGRRQRFPGVDFATLLQLQVTLTQATGTATLTSPNAVPFSVRLFVFPNGTKGHAPDELLKACRESRGYE